MVPPGQPLREHIDDPALTIEREGHLRDEAQVHIGTGEGGVGSDEARVAAHQLDESDAVPRAARLGMGRADGSGCGFDRGGEPEAPLHPIHVVVHRLGDADHGEALPSADGFCCDGRRTPKRPIAADAEQDGDAVAQEGVDHLHRILGPPRRGEVRAQVACVGRAQDAVVVVDETQTTLHQRARPNRGPDGRHREVFGVGEAGARHGRARWHGRHLPVRQSGGR